ncbi:hypothetical protein DKZ29_06215 [Limosilactobacillus reuteri]|uniref:CopG family transcriptional regulator n=1 Tax=Limosilactobacillus reuteri TaxID=1598 RepID=A0ABD6Y7D0_LIMRT|nr:hypothetical protein [Limosilactobacillus reuteri]PWT35130.1 hypothetical protein DKZ24_05350 [Limosilactobacillus reuteri]PWT37684.1 hypothetical protein DKZ35_04190 [Limosilactobacillus reuteri]PWT58282.1 hypothetical protein DKZ29_06215 [Limosilactobacillus reuteri]PWT59926.1 hypothetical protein DKZ30_04575 [Limosilactobacillus reuteri]PWT66576.1 hypothetical protein DKZ28_05060 [Limosilactobacillus reuteri]
MAEDDYLDSASETIKKTDGGSMGSKESPYRLGTNETKPIRVSLDLYELIRRIAFEEKRSMLEITNQLILDGLNSGTFSDYKEYLDK